MRGANLVVLVGHLGKKPQLKYTKNLHAICKFSLATAERRKKENGEYEDLVEWHQVVTWRKLAETVSKFLTTGSLVYVEGKIHYHPIKMEGGKDYVHAQIEARSVVFLGEPKNREVPVAYSFEKDGLDEAKDLTVYADDVPF